MFGGRVMKLDEVAERFALDTVFHDYPVGGTLAELEQIANDCSDFFSHDEWTFAEEYEPYAYISAGAILQLVYDKAWQFKRYYEMVGE
jgi:hypothetical protein